MPHEVLGRRTPEASVGRRLRSEVLLSKWTGKNLKIAIFLIEMDANTFSDGAARHGTLDPICAPFCYRLTLLQTVPSWEKLYNLLSRRYPSKFCS